MRSRANRDAGAAISNQRGPLWLSRRGFVGVAISALVLRNTPANAQDDIEPVRTQLARLLDVLPDRSDDATGEFAPICFVDGTRPGWQRHDAADSRLFQPETYQRIVPEEWEALFGFAPGEIEASIVQPQPEGMLRVIKGRFDSDRIDALKKVIQGNGYESADNSEPLPALHRTRPSDALQGQYPSIAGIDDGDYDTIAFLDNQTLVIASTPGLVQLVRDAERKRIASMTFGPGIGGIRKHEPDAVYEAVIVPGAFVPHATNGPVLLSVAVLTSFPQTSTTPDPGISGAFPDWTVITTLSWREPGHLVTEEETKAYADHVRAAFATTVSTRTGTPVSGMMSLTGVTSEFGTVTLTLRPRSTIPGYYELTDMALNHDLEFLAPPSAW